MLEDSTGYNRTRTRSSVDVIKTTIQGNVPILVTTSYTEGNDDVVYSFDSTKGIFSPFEGIFVLKISYYSSKWSSVRKPVKIDGIYGSQATLYDGDSPVSIDTIHKGAFLCYYDTDEKKLYLL